MPPVVLSELVVCRGVHVVSLSLSHVRFCESESESMRLILRADS